MGDGGNRAAPTRQRLGQGRAGAGHKLAAEAKRWSGWIGLLVVWEVAPLVLDIPSYILPRLSDVLRTLIDNLGFILPHWRVTTVAALFGLGVAFLSSIFIGAALSSSPILKKIFFPGVVGAQMVPKEALAPLLVVWFGFTIVPKVLLATFLAFFPLLMAIMVGLSRFTRGLRLLAASMGAPRLKTFLSFHLWVALPAVFGGLRVGVTLAVVGTVIAEYLGSDVGIGYLVLNASRRLDGPMLYAGLVLLVLTVGCAVRLISFLERRLLGGAAKGRLSGLASA